MRLRRFFPAWWCRSSVRSWPFSVRSSAHIGIDYNIVTVTQFSPSLMNLKLGVIASRILRLNFLSVWRSLLVGYSGYPSFSSTSSNNGIQLLSQIFTASLTQWKGWNWKWGQKGTPKQDEASTMWKKFVSQFWPRIFIIFKVIGANNLKEFCHITLETFLLVFGRFAKMFLSLDFEWKS